MTKPAEVIRQNAQIRWPGATVFERGRNFIKHQHPTETGQFMLDTSIGPLHYGAQEDQEIDTAWVADTGAWQWKMDTNDFQTHARDVFNVGNLFEFRSGASWVVFDPQSINWIDENLSRQQIAIKQPVLGQVDDDILSFPQAYGPGKHFRYQNQSARLQKLITIDNLSDLPAPTVQGNEVWFESEFTVSTSSDITIWLDGVQWEKTNGVRVRTSNMVEFRNADGSQVLWWLDFPRAWDSASGETVGQMEVRRDGGPSSLFITVRIPYAWIQSAVFPVYIDPTVEPQVGASAEDGVAYESSTFFTSTTTDYSLGKEGGQNLFANSFSRYVLNVAKDATITDAYSIFVARLTSSTTTVNARIKAADADDAAAPTNYSNFLSATRTTQFADWDNIGSWNAGATYNSPSFVSVVQAIVNRSGWASGQHIVIFHEDNASSSGVFRAARSYDESTTDAPILHVEYTVGTVLATVATATGAGVAPEVTGSIATQEAYPTADASVGNWTGEGGETSNLYTHIDETTASDSDYVKSEETPSSSPFVVQLGSLTDPSDDTNHVLSYRYLKSATGQGTINLTVQLRQNYTNEGSPGDLIAQWQHNDIGAVTQNDGTLTAGEAGSISAYSSLYVRFVADSA